MSGNDEATLQVQTVQGLWPSEKEPVASLWEAGTRYKAQCLPYAKSSISICPRNKSLPSRDTSMTTGASGSPTG